MSGDVIGDVDSTDDVESDEIGALSRVLSDVFRLEVSLNGDEVEFRGRQSGPSADLVLEKKSRTDVLEVLAEIERLRSSESLGLAFITDTTFEVAVDESSLGRPMRARDDLILENAAEGLLYRLGRPSTAFSIACAKLMADIPRRDRPMMPSPWRYGRSPSGQAETIDPFGLIADWVRLSTLRIESTKKRSEADWRVLSESMFFHLGFNLDLALTPRQSATELSRSSRIQRLRRTMTDELDAPRRTYIPEIVRSYQVALGSESPMLSYLSFYHVAEHWFEDVFLDDVATRVQLAITSPDFSARRKKDIRGVIRTVSKSLRARDESVVINEATALQLTLEKYVDLASLADSISTFDASLLEYYAHTPVGFSSGDTVDLRSPHDERYKRLAQRIYKTRNALVHRKDGDKSRYTPFKDDHALRREIPLIRFVSEAVIIGSSSVL